MYLKHFLSGVSLTCLLALPAIAAEPLQSRGEISVKGGTDRSLLTTEFWAPLAQESDRVLYGDIRLMGDNDENREGNLGIGYRQIHKDAVLGAHGWIDRRRTQHNSTFHQLTFGVERLGHSVDTRANVYVPLNNSRNITTPNIGQSSPYLAGSGIFYDTNGLITETPQYGLDGELGYRIPVLQKQVDAIRIYGGGYHFFRNDTENVTGFRIRTEAQINRIISIGARFQHDEPRGSQGFLEATLKFPFTAKKLYQIDSLRSRLDESPERDVDIVTDSKVDNGLRKEVLNVMSGQVQRVLYVDNTNLVSGDGTRENPFNSLGFAQAAMQDNDIIYINRGDGTSTRMDRGIVVNKSGVQLIGSGSNFIYDTNRFTGSGMYQPVSGTVIAMATVAPVITNLDISSSGTDYATGNGVLITSDNATISGISVTSANNSGIAIYANGAGSVINIVNINNVTTTANGRRGIFALAYNGGFINTVNISNSTANNNAARGIEVRADTNSQIDTVNVERNNISTHTNHGIHSFATINSSINNILFRQNTSSGNVNGIYAQASDSSRLGNVIFENNITSNNSSYGLLTRLDTSQAGNVIFINNRVIDNNSYGLGIEILNTSNIRNAVVDSNTVLRNQNAGIFVTNASASRIDNVAITNNISSNHIGSNGHGIFLRSTNPSSVISNAVISGNTTEQNLRSGIYVLANDGSINNAVMSSNRTKNNNEQGIYLYTQTASSVLNAVLSSNVMTANGIHGAYLQRATGATFNVDMGGGTFVGTGRNTLSGNTGNDLRVDGYALKAQYNWWGAATAPTRITLNGGASVDSTNYLTTAP